MCQSATSNTYQYVASSPTDKKYQYYVNVIDKSVDGNNRSELGGKFSDIFHHYGLISDLKLVKAEEESIFIYKYTEDTSLKCSNYLYKNILQEDI